MTVTNTKSATEHVSTGVETSWVYTFDAQEAGQIKVYVIDEYNVKTDVTASVTVDIATQTVTYGPITAWYKLLIERSTTPTQEVDLSSQGPLLPEVLENALDKLTYISQESKNIVEDFRESVAGDIKFVGDWTAGVIYLKNQAVTRYGNMYVCLQAHTSDDTNGPADLASNQYWSIVAVKGASLNWRGSWALGVQYSPNDAYEHNGASYVCKQGHTSTADTEPGVGASWSSYQDTMVLSVPSDGSITTAKLADGAVTPPKIDTTSSGWDFTEVTARLSSWANVRLRSDTGSVLLRNDGTAAYFLLTDTTDPDGGFNALRPIRIDLSSGEVRLCGANEPCYINGSLAWHDGNFASRIAALTANTAPAGTESVACDDGQRISIATIRKASFTSGAITLLSGDNSYTVAHGLGSVPSEVRAYIKCIVPEWGYNVGDILQLATNIWWYSVNRGTYITADATNIYFANSGSTLTIVEKGTVTIQAVTVSNWELYLEAVK